MGMWKVTQAPTMKISQKATLLVVKIKENYDVYNTDATVKI